jgi:hypothetical protein
LVKGPFLQSSKNKAMGQILVTNQHLDKILAAHVHFMAHGMLKGPNPTIDIISGLHSGPMNHEPPANKVGPQVTQHIWPATGHHSDPKHDTDSVFANCEHHNSRAEDNPKANAEINLSKTWCTFLLHLSPSRSQLFHSAKSITQYISTCTED